MNKILVCGGRSYSNYDKIKEVLSGLDPKVIIHGDAKGADGLAGRYARENGICEVKVPANWPVYNKAAGPIRNGWMIDLKPNLVVAFSGGSGTANMIKIAKANGVEVLEIND